MNSVWPLVGMKMTRRLDAAAERSASTPNATFVLSACLHFARLEPHDYQRVDLIQEPLTTADVVVVVWCQCDIAFFRTYISM